ncbi:MAG: flagellar motor stator protein MotA [Pseudomonadota bacterium]
MLPIIGVVIVFSMVFGGYLIAGGKMGIILSSLPYEMMMILGAAVGAFVISTDSHGLKHTISSVKKVGKGTHWNKEDYRDLLVLLHELMRTGKQNPVALEEQIENPEASPVFANFPKLLADKEATALICDTLRAAAMNFDDPHQVEDLLTKRIETRLHEQMHPSHALQTIADGLPALGIVAAVLGVIKTMASIDQPPAVLGKMIGGALVGTFLGVFLAYAFVGPAANKVKEVVEADHAFYLLIREVMVAYLHRHPPNIAIEVGRQNIPSDKRPDFDDLEEAVRSAQPAPAQAA